MLYTLKYASIIATSTAAGAAAAATAIAIRYIGIHVEPSRVIRAVQQTCPLRPPAAVRRINVKVQRAPSSSLRDSLAYKS